MAAAGGGGSYSAAASRQTDGLGFQATLFTAPPTWTVFTQRAEDTSQNLTEPSSLPAHRAGWRLQPGGKHTAAAAGLPEASHWPPGDTLMERTSPPWPRYTCGFKHSSAQRRGGGCGGAGGVWGGAYQRLCGGKRLQVFGLGQFGDQVLWVHVDLWTEGQTDSCGFDRLRTAAGGVGGQSATLIFLWRGHRYRSRQRSKRSWMKRP